MRYLNFLLDNIFLLPVKIVLEKKFFIFTSSENSIRKKILYFYFQWK